MIAIKTITPYIGQVWTAMDKQFRITDMTVTEDDAWVYYTNINTLEEYSCRLEAFTHRFQPQVN